SNDICPTTRRVVKCARVSNAGTFIYAPRLSTERLGLSGRLGAAGMAVACGGGLGVAAWLRPDPSGGGNHTEIGLESCQFLLRTGIPCPTCGMTTSFSHFAHGQFLASAYVQPMGAVLALLTAMLFWGALYVAMTGKPAFRLMPLISTRYHLLGLMVF